jgi:protein-tyrosine phosphatase
LFWRHRKQHRIDWLTDDIAISAEPSADDWPGLRAAGVRCVLDLRQEALDNAGVVNAAGLGYLRVPIAEGEAPSQDELRLATGWIDEHLGTDGPVLIHCREGRGRSATVAVAALVNFGMPLFEAYRITMRVRPQTSINDAQQEALRRFAEARERFREAGS